MKLLLATNNKHKAEEIKAIISDNCPQDAFDILLPSDILGLNINPDESGDTLEANALIKAKAFFDATGISCIADDTGLEVYALDGLPGVKSARFAGDNANDAGNRAKLLDMLVNIDLDKRDARFRTVFCYYDGKKPQFAEGKCNGKIISNELGEGGFGYDSIFVPEGYEHTFAELDYNLKNKISHRYKALIALIDLLKNL